MVSEKLFEQVLKTLRNYEMICSDDKVLACVSGGPDSIFLLHALLRMRSKLNITVCACNLDHGIRKKESRRDSLFVKRAAETLGIKLIQKRIRLEQAGSARLSLEEKARNLRYGFFLESAKNAGANVIATGHTLDDQAETVLMRIIKGASLKGAAGIPPVRVFKGIRIIRPLIEIEKNAIVTFLRKERIRFVVDSSNEDEKYFRNATRKRILPFLEQFNPRIRRSLFHFSQHMREDALLLEEVKKLRTERPKREGGGRVVIALKDIVVQPRALQKEVMRDCLEKAGGNVKKLTYRHWKEIEQLIRVKRAGSSVHLPGGVCAARTQRLLLFSRLS